AGLKLACVERGIRFTYVFEYKRERFGGVEIVIHGFAESRQRAPGMFRELRIRTFGKLRRIETKLEIAQPLDSRLRRSQSIECEIQRLSVRHRPQQIPDRFRRNTASKDVA